MGDHHMRHGATRETVSPSTSRRGGMLMLGGATAAILLTPAAVAQTAGDNVQQTDPVQQVDPLQQGNQPPGAIVPSLPSDPGRKAKKRLTAADRTQSDFSGAAGDVAAANAGLFLGFSTYNGREVSGAGNSRVNDMKQFPVELFRTDFVQSYTTAKDIEGALFGTLETTSARPLDQKKRHVQAEVRGAYYPYADRAHQGLGNRISGSYVDQFNTGIGRIGISLGILNRTLPQPREYNESGTNYKPCNSVDAGTLAGGPATTGICSYNAKSTNPLYYASGFSAFRQERVVEKVQGYYGQLQWQPSARLDMTWDVAHSHRNVSRYRGQLDLSDVWSGIAPLQIGSDGQLLKWKGYTGLQATSFQRVRNEVYTSLGWNTRWHATDRLTIDADASFQRTYRTQNDVSTQLDANSGIGAGGVTPYTITENNAGFASVDFGNAINLNDYSLFTNNPTLRRGSERRVDRIWALRLDASYDLGNGLFNALRIGSRYSDHIRNADLKTYGTNSSGISPAAVAAANAACRIAPIVDSFGTEAGTNINSFAQFDPTCMFTALAGTNDPNTTLTTLSGGGMDITERIFAGYAMADFSGAIGDTKFAGNVGLRVVNTVGDTRVYKYDSKLADLIGVSDHFSITNLLPSASAVFKPGHGLTMRAGIARTLLRSNIEGFGLRRTLQGSLIDGNRPNPLLSWNADLSFEYRADRDTAFLYGVHYKLLDSSVWPGDALIPGGPVLPAWLVAARDRGSYIRGFEVGVNRTFHSLPAPFDGFAVRASYAFNDSNFRFADPTATDPANPLYLFASPAGVPGLARNTVAASAEYRLDRLRLGLRYEYNDGFFRPTGFTANRYRASNQYLNANAALELNAHADILLTASNLTNQPEQYFRPVADNNGQTPYTGRTYTFALRVHY